MRYLALVCCVALIRVLRCKRLFLDLRSWLALGRLLRSPGALGAGQERPTVLSP